MRIWRTVALGAAFTMTWALSAASPQAQWIEAWYSPPFPPTAVLTFNDVRQFARQTVRQVVRLEVGGSRLRVRLTNELGLSPVRVGSVHIALSSPNAVTEAETDHVLTFNGRREADIPVGQPLVSDPVEMPVGAFTDLGISVYYPGRLTPAGHLAQVRLSTTGDHGAESVWQDVTTVR